MKECTFAPKTNLKKAYGADHRRNHTLGMSKSSVFGEAALRREEELPMPFERSEGGKTPEGQPGALLRTGATKSMVDLAISPANLSGFDQTPKRPSGGSDAPNVFEYLSSGRLLRNERLKALQDQKEQ